MEFDGNDDAPKPPPNAARIVPHFPLFWLLIPQILAFAFCANAPWFSEIPVSRWLFAGTLFLFFSVAASAGEHLFSNGKKDPLFVGAWKICFPIAAFFIFCAWWNFRAPPLEDWTGKSPREIEIEFRIEKMFASAGKNFGGLARTEKISGEGVDVLAGTRIRFSVPKKLFENTEDVPAEGAVLRAYGVISGVEETEFLKGEFLDYLKRKRVSAIFSRTESAKLLPRGDGFFFRWCTNAKADLRQNLLTISAGSAWHERAGRVLGAMLLGDRSLLLPEQKTNFLLTGTMHIFAVSGLHISILATGALALLRAFRVPRLPAWLVAIGALWVYTQIVGAPPSAMRAWAMLVFLFLGTVFGRGRMAFHGLICSAFFALLAEPTVLNDTGFRLSYLVVAAILLYGIPLAEVAGNAVDTERWLPRQVVSLPRKMFAKVRDSVVSGTCISMAAFLAGTPIVTAMFGICSFVSLAANVVLIPLVSLAAWLGAGALVLACFPWCGKMLGKLLFNVAAFPLAVIDFGTEIFSKIPGVAELSFPHYAFGIAGSLLLFALFFFGEILPQLRERPVLRFVLPPLTLAVFLLIFAY